MSIISTPFPFVVSLPSKYRNTELEDVIEPTMSTPLMTVSLILLSVDI